MRAFVTKLTSTVILTASMFYATISYAETEVVAKARLLFDQEQYSKLDETLAYFKKRNSLDSVGALILAIRFAPNVPGITDTLAAITGEDHGRDWNDWMLWQERNPQIKPFEGFNQIHADIHKNIDGNFQLFLGGDREYNIRVEEITWGGRHKRRHSSTYQSKVDVHRRSNLYGAAKPRIWSKHQW